MSSGDNACPCCKALWIKFYLTEPLTQNDDQALAKIFTDSASKRHFWHGEDPDPNDEGFPVYNLESVNPHPGEPPYKFLGSNGTIGLACLDESDPEVDRYRIVTLESPSGLVMFRLEEELVRGMAANARLVDPSTVLTMQGSSIIVQDDENKWFGRGEIAPSGDYGGDPKGNANIGFAMKAHTTDEGQVGSGDPISGLQVYSIISMGTWFRWIKGVLLGDEWKVGAGDVTGHDGEWPRSDTGTDTGQITLVPLGCLEAAYGVEFLAKFNERTSRYEVVSACCPE